MFCNAKPKDEDEVPWKLLEILHIGKQKVLLLECRMEWRSKLELNMWESLCLTAEDIPEWKSILWCLCRFLFHSASQSGNLSWIWWVWSLQSSVCSAFPRGLMMNDITPKVIRNNNKTSINWAVTSLKQAKLGNSVKVGQACFLNRR